MYYGLTKSLPKPLKALKLWEPPRKINGCTSARTSRLAPIGALSPTRLLPQSEFANDHRAVGALAHVVDRQCGDRASMQRLHFDACAVNRVDLRFDRNVVVAEFKVDIHSPNQQRMTQRNHLGRAL